MRGLSPSHDIALALVDCSYYDANSCRSCTWLPVPYDEQLTRTSAYVESLLPTMAWLPPVASAEEGFRNKAKMVVAGTIDQPTLGILDPQGGGIDLQGCGLHEPGIVAALPVLADFIVRARIAPYDLRTRTGELKHLLLTRSSTGQLMVRFVCRSQEPVTRLRKHLPALVERLPELSVVSVNLQPEHKAVLEGERELVLSDAESLDMPVNDVVLQLRPQSFFQTNTAVAAALYRQAREWVDEVSPAMIWDLYCGVGGFARHLAAPGRQVTGVEISPAAVDAALRDAGPGLGFEVGDAEVWVRDRETPDLVVVNPPRRGIGTLAATLEHSAIEHVIYSSCNAESLSRDLAMMPSLRPVRGRVLDMFPQTSHFEVLVQLRRG